MDYDIPDLFKRLRELEAENRHLKAVVEAAWECCERWSEGDKHCSCDYSYKCRIWPKLREALAVLEEVEE